MDKAYAALCSPCAWVCFLALLLLGPQAYAQQPDSGVRGTVALDRGYLHTVWTIEDGLLQNSINAIVQTHDGYLWLATFSGLVRFDGITFTVFNVANAEGLVSDRIVSLYEDRAGRLWMGHEYGGLTRYQDGVFTGYTTAEGLPKGLVNAIIEDPAGNLWVATGRGLGRFTDGVFTTYTVEHGLPSNRVHALHIDQNGQLLVGAGGGPVRYEDGHFVPFAEVPNIKGRGVWSFLTDPAGNLWLASGHGLVRYTEGKSTLVYPRTPPWWRLPLAQDQTGHLWLGYPGGLLRFDEIAPSTTGREGGYQSHRLFPSHFDGVIRSLLVDREGNLWVGTDGKGLSRLKRTPLTHLSTDHGLPDNGVAVVTADGTGGLWLAAGCNTLTHFQNNTFNTIYTAPNTPNHLGCVRALLRDRDGRLWIGGDQHLFAFKDGIYTHYTPADGLPDNAVTDLFEDRAGRLWVGTRDGLALFDGRAFTVFTVEDGLIDNGIRFITEDRAGGIWIGTYGGLSRFQGGSFTNYTPEDGLPRGSVRAIHEDPDGVLWVGTYGGGLARLKDGLFTSFTVADGLFENAVNLIIEDERGNLWMLGSLGLSYTSRAHLNAFAEGRLASIPHVSFGKDEGMEAGGGSGPVAQTSDGKTWFSTMNGIVGIDINAYEPNAVPPPVVIERVLADGQAMDLRKDVTVPPGPRDLEIHYTGLSYAAPEQVRFKYKLDGRDGDWIEAGTRRVAYYTNIPPGAYTFRVIAANNDGLWNEEGASYGFVLAPYFFETLWFYGLVVLLVLLLGYAGYRQRTRSIRARNAVLAALNDLLNQEVKEREHAEELLGAKHVELEIQHEAMKATNTEIELRNAELERYAYTVSHDLKNPLVTIKTFTGVLREDIAIGEADRVEADLTHIETAAGQMYRLLNDLLELSRQGRVINASEEVSLSVLAEEAVGLLAGLTVARGVEVEIAPDQPIVWGDRVRLREVYQNLIENAVKYMGSQAAPRIEVGARNNGGDEVLCWVRDNGIGIDPAYHERVFRLFEQLDPSKEGTGIGLALVKRILEVHGGRIWVESEGVGHGATFCFILPAEATYREGVF